LTLNCKEWKERVLRCVNSHCGATFANILQEMGANTSGDAELTHPVHRNLVLWNGLDAGLAAAIKELLDERRIVYERTLSIVYIMDGRILPLPEAGEEKEYPVPHWLPVALYAVRGGTQ